MITKTSLQSVQAMLELAKLPNHRYEGACSIAKRIKAPQNYLGKLLQTLANHRLVHSRKGLGGGFCLAKKPKHINLFDIVDPIENISRKVGCFLGKTRCSEKDPCPAHNRWKAAQESYMNFLMETTLEDLREQQNLEKNEK